MVKLVVTNPAQISFLEYALMSANIEYETIIDGGAYGVKPPYLLVYGAPLDEVRAFKWINYVSNLNKLFK